MKKKYKGFVKTSYDYNEIVYDHWVCVKNTKTNKMFYLVYVDNYYLGKAIQRIKRSKSLWFIASNYKKY